MRKLKRIVKGEAGVYGAGVHLTHVLSRHTMDDSDPLLLLDAFDSTNYDEYKAINSDEIKEIDFDGSYLRLLAGSYKDYTGYKSKYCPVSYYDIHIKPGHKFSLDLEEDDSLTLFSLIGEVYVGGERLPNFNAGLTELGGKELVLENKSDQEISVLAFISKRIDEPIAWTPGPIVMNTQEELDQAYKEVEEETFIKDEIDMNI